MKLQVFCTLTSLVASLLLAACGGPPTDELLKSARQYLAKNDGKSAVIQLKTALQKAPDSGEARLLLGEAFLKNGDPVSAAVELQKALDLKQAPSAVLPLLAKALLAQRQFQLIIDKFAALELDDASAAADVKTSVAAAFLALGDLTHARQAVADALVRARDDPAALLLQARLDREEGKFDAALALVDKVIAQAPGNSHAWNEKGELLFRKNKDIDGAMQAHSKALSVDSNDVEARARLISLLLGKGDLKGAQEQIDLLRKRLPKNPQTTLFDAQLALQKQQPKEARELIRQVLKAVPDNPGVLQLAGAIESANGSLLEAERAWSKSLLLAPDRTDTRQQLARAYLRLGQPAKALRTLEPLLAAPQDDAQTNSLAAEAYLAIGDVAKAEAAFVQAVKLNPGSVTARTALAMTQMKTSGVAATADKLRRIAAQDSGVYADLALVNVYLRQKDDANALLAVDTLEAKQRDKPIASYLRGWIYQTRNDAVRARASYERALALDPVFVPAANNLAALDLASDKPDEARKRFESILGVSPDNVQALLALANLRARQAPPKEEVVGLLNKVIKLSPSDAAPRLLLVDFLLGKGDPQAALSNAQAAQAALPESVEILDALGRAQAAAGDSNQAIGTFNKMAALNPQSPQPQMRIAGAQLGTKSFAAAEQSLRKALSIDAEFLPAHRALFDLALSQQRPQDALAVARSVQKLKSAAAPAGWLMEGDAQMALRHFSAAAIAYRTAVKNQPTSSAAAKLHTSLLAQGMRAEADQHATSWMTSHPKDAEFLSYYGELNLATGNVNAAEADFRRVIDLRPTAVSALNNLALALVRLNKPGALPYAEKAVQLQPANPALLDTLATVLAADRQLDKAVSTQKRALTLAPEDPLLRLNLARLLAQAGDKAGARIELDVLAKLGAAFARQAEVTRLQKAL